LKNSYAKILNYDFLVKNFGVAIFQRKLRQKSFIGSGPGSYSARVLFLGSGLSPMFNLQLVSDETCLCCLTCKKNRQELDSSIVQNF